MSDGVQQPMARILVIDDHDPLREGMTVTLTRSGHTVAAARSGADGLEPICKVVEECPP